jgi:tetratricopeptide (TPR) repeat protein
MIRKMSKILLALLLLSINSTLTASVNDSLFNLGNSYYENGKYEVAAETYMKILQKGYTSGELLYNIANSYFRSNKIGKARLYYEKALLQSPRDNAIRANLAYTESLLTDKFEEVPVFFLKRWGEGLRMAIAPKTWSILALGVFFVSFVLLVIFLFSKSMSIKKASFFPGVILFFISIICLLFSFSASNHLKNSGTAIITAPSVIVKSAPQNSGKDLFIIHEGTKVWLGNKSGDFQEIKVSDGRIGWLLLDEMEKI